MIKVKAHCNWCEDFHLLQRLNRSSPEANYTWKDIQFTADDDYDFFVIFNHPRHSRFNPAKTIVLNAETKTSRRGFNVFFRPDNTFFRNFNTENNFNVDVWYMTLSFKQLLNTNLFTKSKILSSVISSNGHLPGHKDRLKFVYSLDSLIYHEHYGTGSFPDLKTHKGSLENKELGLLPFQYHFNAENDYEDNYFTEKITDAILCESLCFYDGCTNITKFFDEESFVKINLKSPEESLEVIKKSISDNLRAKRLSVILKEKQKIMYEMNPLNTIWKIIHGQI
jgi:hypothetical protein